MSAVMKQGFQYAISGELAQIVEDKKGQWWQRQSNGGGFGVWQKILPPHLSMNKDRLFVQDRQVHNTIHLTPMGREPRNQTFRVFETRKV